MATPNRNVEQQTHVPPVNNGPPFSNGFPSDGKRSLTAGSGYEFFQQAHGPPPHYGTGNGFYQQAYPPPPQWGHGNGFSQQDGKPSAYPPPPQWGSGNGFSQQDGKPSAYGPPPPQYGSAYGFSQQGTSPWSCDECKHQLNGTWYRPDYDLCHSCYKGRLLTSAEWVAYESKSSETRCDECKHIIAGVKYTVSYDICQGCAILKPFYSPLNCGYRPTSSQSCPDTVGAIVLRCWPAPHAHTPEHGSRFGFPPQGYPIHQQQWQAPFAAQPQYQLPPSSYNQQALGTPRVSKPKKNYMKAGMKAGLEMLNVVANVAFIGGAMPGAGFGTGFGN